MRYEDEQDPKKPRPVKSFHKGTNPREGAEYSPLRHDGDQDRHKHVC